MSGKESRKNDNGNADDDPRHDGNGPLTRTLALNLPDGAEPAVEKRQKSALVAEVMNDQAKTTEEALKTPSSRAEVPEHLEHCLEGIFQTTPEGKYISANPALARMYGYGSAEELIADLTDITRQLYVQPGRRDQFIRLVRRTERSSILVANFSPDRNVIWISESARVVRDEVSDEVLYYEGMVQDISRRKPRRKNAIRPMPVCRCNTRWLEHWLKCAIWAKHPIR